MFTYELANRAFHRVGGKPFSFPSRAIIRVFFGPSVAFGSSHEPSRYALEAGKGHFVFEDDGRLLVKADPPLQPLNFDLRLPSGSEIRLRGNVLELEQDCADEGALRKEIEYLRYHAAAIINLALPGPPHIRSIAGTVGDVDFQYIDATKYLSVEVVGQHQLENELKSLIRQTDLFVDDKNIRLFAALEYLRIARRLIISGVADSEFMAEAIVNLTKSLQIMFGESQNKIRAGLRKLDRTHEEIERDYIPLVILRNKFGSGHAMIAALEPDHREVIYNYTVRAEKGLRLFFRELLNLVARGEYAVAAGDRIMDAEKKKVIAGLVESMKAGWPQSNDTSVSAQGSAPP